MILALVTLLLGLLPWPLRVWSQMFPWFVSDVPGSLWALVRGSHPKPHRRRSTGPSGRSGQGPVTIRGNRPDLGIHTAGTSPDR
jgi:hypothetical protein